MNNIRVGWLSFSSAFERDYMDKLALLGCDTICLADDNPRQITCLILHSDDRHRIKNRILLEFRKISPNIPAIIMSDVPSIGRADMIQQGIDDVVSPNIHIMELYARLFSLHQRYDTSRYLKQVGQYMINYWERIISFHNIEIPLKPREFLLFEYLLRQSPNPISRSELLVQLWKLRHEPGTNSVEVHIWRLRHTLEEYIPHAPEIITLRGKGYTIADPVRSKKSKAAAMV